MPTTHPTCAQVLSLINYPDLVLDPANAATAAALYPADALARARSILASNPSGTGAYSESKGVSALRAEVAAFLEKRDGHAADPDDIFLTDGARCVARAAFFR